MKISKIEKVIVEMADSTRLLERATERAIQMALQEFGVDDDGYANRVKGWVRSCCSIHLSFVGIEMSGGMGGWHYVVKFDAWCEKCED